MNNKTHSTPDHTLEEDGYCFNECDCCCGEHPDSFDKAILEETKFQATLEEITHSNISWYTDRSMDNSGLVGLAIDEPDGIYILWHKNDYCNVHGLFHMKALYVGKGKPKRRLKIHWATKNTADEMLIYFTFYACSNRASKYIEQLLLDIYDLPMNKYENNGTATLCAYFSQNEVD